MTQRSPFRYFKTSAEVIRVALMPQVRYQLSLRNLEDLPERGIVIGHESVRLWLNRFGPILATEILRRKADRMPSLPHWRWLLD